MEALLHDWRSLDSVFQIHVLNLKIMLIAVRAHCSWLRNRISVVRI